MDDKNVTNFYLNDEVDAGEIMNANMVAPNNNEYEDMLVEDRPERDDITDELVADKYIGTELILGVGLLGNERKGWVTKRMKCLYGEEIRCSHSNPLFNTTRECVVEFTDGTEENYFANVVAENMFAQVDSEGWQYLLMSEITDHRQPRRFSGKASQRLCHE